MPEISILALAQFARSFKLFYGSKDCRIDIYHKKSDATDDIKKLRYI